jgi:hypothetical protein
MACENFWEKLENTVCFFGLISKFILGALFDTFLPFFSACFSYGILDTLTKI